MKAKTLLVTAAAIAAFGFAAFKIAGTPWKIDAQNSKVSFDMPGAKHSGTFSGLIATVDFDPLDPGKAVINASVDASTVNTGIEKLDTHLKSADFFDVAKHPRISFTADQVVKTDTGFVAVGRLALRDSVRAIMVPFKLIPGEKQSTLKGTMQFYSGDYGVGQKSPKGNDLTIVTIEVPVSQ